MALDLGIAISKKSVRGRGRRAIRTRATRSLRAPHQGCRELHAVARLRFRHVPTTPGRVRRARHHSTLSLSFDYAHFVRYAQDDTVGFATLRMTQWGSLRSG